MITQLNNEEKEYIDNILSSGLDEIKDVPSFEISTVSNLTTPIQNNDYLTYSTSSINNNNIFKNSSNNLNQINYNFDNGPKIINSVNNYSNNLNKIPKIEFKNNTDNNKNMSPEQKPLYNLNTPTLNYNDKEEYNSYCFNTINQNINENIKNESMLVIPWNIPNNREIIENALLNNQKNLNKLNKQISGNNLEYSQNDKINKNEKGLSVSTRQLIDKYIDLKISNCSKNSNNIKNCEMQNNLKETDKILDKKEKENIKDSHLNLLFNGNNSVNNMTNSLLEKNSKNSFFTNSNNEQTIISKNSEILKIHELSDLNNNNNINKYYEINKDENSNNEANIDNKKINNNNINNDYNYTKKKGNKYKPKSSALKKLIDKLKKEENLYDNNNNEESYNKDNKNYIKVDCSKKSNTTSNNSINTIQLNQMNDSELFTLGNSNITYSTLKTKNSIKKSKNRTKIDDENSFFQIKKHKKNKNSVEHNKYNIINYPQTEIRCQKVKEKNYKNTDIILNSKENYNKLKKEMNSIQDQINIISHRIEVGSSSKRNISIKKTYSAKSIRTNSKKRFFFPSSSTSSLNIEYNVYSKKKNRPCSDSRNILNYNNKKKKFKIIKEDNDYKLKYKELREKFESQREKMKSEKQNIISLQQKIKIIDKKLEKYPELVECNKTLNEQNKTLEDNLNISDQIRKKQSILIEALQNEIKMIKNKINGNYLDTNSNNDNDNDKEINNYYIDTNEEQINSLYNETL